MLNPDIDYENSLAIYNMPPIEKCFHEQCRNLYSRIISNVGHSVHKNITRVSAEARVNASL